MMKILKSVLFSTVFLTGVYESSASLSSEEIEGILNSSSGRSTNFLRAVQPRIDPLLYNKFRNSLNSAQTAAQAVELLRGVISELRAEEAQRGPAGQAALVAPASDAPLLRSSRDVKTAAPVVDDFAASVGNAVHGTEMRDEVLMDQSPSKRSRPEEPAVFEPMDVVLEAEAFEKSRAILLSQIADLEGHKRDLVASYATSQSSFEAHQEERAQRRLALGELQGEISKQREILDPLLQMKKEWTGKVGKAYGSLGVALLTRDENTPSQQQALDKAMQAIYEAPDLDSQEGPMNQIRSILGLNEKNPLPDLFYKINILKHHWELLQGKPAFSTTLQTPAVQEKYKIVANILPQIVEFNRALVEHLDPAHLDFHKITAKSSAVAVALAENNDADLRKFLQKDGFEERRRVLQAKNYTGSLSRITEKLKAVALELQGAKIKKDQDAIKQAMAALTSAGLPGDIEKWTLDAVEEAIDSQSDAAIAQISLESFKETALPQIYGPTMDSLQGQWAETEQKRNAWLDKVRDGLSDGEIGALQAKISVLESQAQVLGQSLSDLDGALGQETQELEKVKLEIRRLDSQLEALRQQ
jgi:hypothetical protein